MTNIELITWSGILGILAGVVIVMLVIFPILKKRGVNIENMLDQTKKAVDSSGEILNVIKTTMPNNNVVNILQIVQKWAQIAVGDAEQLYHAGNISKEDRAKVAESVVLNVLKELNIEVDESKKHLIDAAIENAVNELGHSNVKKIAPEK
ncbi:hypothetical protein BJV85_003134 [Clostridium acetobutylicum]|uniref:Uncharacterized protein n=1 Tax=Clostridium acetobutylicum (strain ATCC 824 / DSM 792 / JCM 1419 / IAM 19013 / LMG 5710 / NBRC 13948 / NRRL B-527 / VKM B-1787 / 2291 / W) TaxID=272562 RepID=Q97KP3_CLOAB|nr:MULTISPECIES: hypothetical protein [Clostridium]AAK78850.1 Hypothetical protein, CF-36 family [Clostridium acetobutylicum ATCC 824]ADZ19925.1 conserved hypothetical protein [Clostridium acetobutylicum EA 2018]AEI31484.1 hypothetical protein SMB_G0891 [Clostridium acetobutylicum DSM 1731]AWV80569.1 hypothetical protein DK921_10770 [Clostridium acetobutylicum]MBC2392759.1 hypothetical protein [Clostridium acetobutylicum]